MKIGLLIFLPILLIAICSLAGLFGTNQIDLSNIPWGLIIIGGIAGLILISILASVLHNDRDDYGNQDIIREIPNGHAFNVDGVGAGIEFSNGRKYILKKVSDNKVRIWDYSRNKINPHDYVTIHRKGVADYLKAKVTNRYERHSNNHNEIW